MDLSAPRAGRSLPGERVTWILAAAIAIQAWLLFSPDTKLIVWPDSIGYVGPAIDAIEGGPFTHWAGRTSGYAAFLWALLTVRPEPEAIVFAQRLLVMTTGVFVALAIRRLVRCLPATRHVGEPWIALLVVFWMAAYVLYPPVTGMAHLLMAEALFGFLLSVVALGLIVQAAPPRSRTLAAAVTAATMVASVALGLVKPHWWAAALIVPIAVVLMAPAGSRRLTGAVAAAATIVAAVLLIVPELRLQTQYDAYVSRVHGPRSLFCNSADLVHEYLLRQSPDPVAAAASRSIGQVLTADARASAQVWPLLGFDADACTYGEPARAMQQLFAGRPDDEAAFYTSTYTRALAQQPAYLVARVARHAIELARKPYNATGGDYFLRADLTVMEQNRQTRRTFERWLTSRPAIFEGLIALPTRRIEVFLRAFFVIAGVLLVTCTLLALPIAAASRRVAAMRPLRASFVGLLSITVAIDAFIAAVATFEPRYIAMQAPLFAVLGFSASMIVADWAGAFRGAVRT